MSRSPNPRSPSPEKQSGSLRARALRLLARREHSRRELERKLAPCAGDAQELEALLDEFTARGWLREARVAEQVIHARRGRFGSARIREELLARGVAEEVVASMLSELRAGDLEAAIAVWRRKFRTPPTTSAERARQIRFLQGRGFALETILKVIRSAGADDENA
ncbi:MAG TPA: recombination regulator RecX [Burkholderiales bacterium]|nr:recombination regulator RecX [Burkholderiales bacterium]